MRGNSNTQPSRLERIGKQYQIRWNITRNDRVAEDNETIESWDFEYANADSCTREDIIRTLIRDKYPLIDDEIAIINNATTNPDEYAAYQDWRAQAKQIADETILRQRKPSWMAAR